MIAELLKQQEDEKKKQKDFCVEGFNTNEAGTTEKEREKTDLTTLIEDLTCRLMSSTKPLKHSRQRLEKCSCS